MCLVIDMLIHRETEEMINNGMRVYNIPKPHVSDKDILVFKGLNIRAVHFQGTDSVSGCNFTGSWSTYPSHNFETPYMRECVVFEEGIAILDVSHFSFGYDSFDGTIVTRGIHTSRDWGIAKGYGNYVFYAVIPAGTEYYLGTFSDVVSKKIVIFETPEDFEEYKKTHNVMSVNELYQNAI